MLAVGVDREALAQCAELIKMPCSTCGSTSHTTRGCAKRTCTGDGSCWREAIELEESDEENTRPQHAATQAAQESEAAKAAAAAKAAKESEAAAKAVASAKAAAATKAAKAAATAKAEESARAAKAAADAEQKAKEEAEKNKLLKQLECPVCLSTMLSPIRQCANGHTLCDACSATVDKCPICRLDGRPSMRCLALEQMACSLSIGCPHEGCARTEAYSSIGEHAKRCSFRPLTCFRCPIVLSVVTPATYVAHMREAHDARPHEVQRDGSVTIEFQNLTVGTPSSWPSQMISAFGRHYQLDVKCSAESYSCCLFGIGVVSSFEMSVKADAGLFSGWSLSFKRETVNIFSYRSVSTAYPFLVPVSYAHMISASGTHSTVAHLFRLTVRIFD